MGRRQAAFLQPRGAAVGKGTRKITFKDALGIFFTDLPWRFLRFFPWKLQFLFSDVEQLKGRRNIVSLAQILFSEIPKTR